MKKIIIAALTVLLAHSGAASARWVCNSMGHCMQTNSQSGGGFGGGYGGGGGGGGGWGFFGGGYSRGGYNKNDTFTRNGVTYIRRSIGIEVPAFLPDSDAPATGPANAKGTLIFDPHRLTWAAYNSTGDLVRVGSASGGQDFCADIGQGCKTPVGKFRVWGKGGPDCVSGKYPVGEGGAPMPNCMYFHGGYAIHGSYEVPHFNASHGCIRVVPVAAEWLTHNFVETGTVVIVRPY